MIQGYFVTIGTTRRPYLQCSFEFPGHPDLHTTYVELLVDTGADVTLLSPIDAEDMGLRLATLDIGPSSAGVGGVISTRVVEARLNVQGYSTFLPVHIPDVHHPVRSLLGRDFMRDFALFMEERTGRVLLLDQDDLESFGIPPLS
jgi:predicted aspartyl protease